MKKKVLFLLPLFLGACSDSGESPVITIEKLYVKVDQGDGETIREDGNGAELKSFQLQNGEEMKTELRYEKTEVTTEGNLTDEEKGQLRFKDGVTKTKVLVHATIEHVDKNGDVQLSFYLSSKAECEGAQEVIDLKTEVVENE